MAQADLRSVLPVRAQIYIVPKRTEAMPEIEEAAEDVIAAGAQ